MKIADRVKIKKESKWYVNGWDFGIIIDSCCCSGFKFTVQHDNGWIRYYNVEDFELVNERSFKVGDVLIDSAGNDRKILEVLDNTLAIKYVNRRHWADNEIDNSLTIRWMSFDEIEKLGWKLKNVCDKCGK